MGDDAGAPVRRGIAHVITNESILDAILAALSDRTRRQILDRLAERGGATATALAAGLPVSRQAVVKHLAVLDRAGLVVSEKRGREVRYAPRSEPIEQASRWLASAARRWDERLATIRRIAESEPMSDT